MPTPPGARHVAPRPLRRLPVVLLAVFALTLSASCERPAADPQAVNVVLISVDTLRADFLNGYGYDEHTVSPVIDRLASEGVLFEQHIVSSPWTTPSHMSLLTSLHPSSHGVNESFRGMRKGMRTGHHKKLAEARVTLAEALRLSGYATAAFTGGVTLAPEIGFGQGFQRYETSMYKLTERNVGEMLAWLDAHAAGPFFLFFHTFEVHAPFLHPDLLGEEHAALVPELRALAEGLRDPEGHFEQNKTFRLFLETNGAFDRETLRDLYAGGVRSVDGWTGRLVERLEALGVYDRTLIVFTSDHGDELGDHDPGNVYDKHGHAAWDEIIQVPLILKLPHQRHAGTRVAALTRAVDVMPTVLEIVGVAPAHDEMQGVSLQPLWSGTEPAGKRIAFSEGAAMSWEIKSMRTQTHKLIVRTNAEAVRERGRSFIPEALEERRLFDLREDPGEKRDLLEGVPGPTALALADRMEADLRAWIGAQEGTAEEVVLDPRTIEQLRSLGYVD